MKMHPSHRPCLLALAALPARSRTIDLRGNVTHTGNLGSPNRWLGGSVVRWLGSCANPQPETHTSRPENEGLVPKAPILKYRIILRGQANIMQIACAVAGSVPRFSDEDLGWSEEISSEKGVRGISSKDPIYLSPSPIRGSGGEPDCYLTCILNIKN